MAIRNLLLSLVQVAAVLWLLATSIFLSSWWIGGNPVDLWVDPRLDTTTRQQIEANFGYDKPVLQQYVHYLSGLAHGDMGVSFTRKQPVSRVLFGVLPHSAALGCLALLWAIFITLLTLHLAHFGGTRWWGKFGRQWDVFGILVPSFLWAALFRWLLGRWFGWFPFVNLNESASWMNEWLLHGSIPAIAISLPIAAQASTYLNSRLEELVQLPYAIAARGRGVHRLRILWFHLLPQVVPSAIQLLGLNLPIIAGGALVVECVFGWSGLGTLLFDATLGRDVPLLVGASLYIGLFSVLGYQLADRWRKSI